MTASGGRSRMRNRIMGAAVIAGIAAVLAGPAGLAAADTVVTTVSAVPSGVAASMVASPDGSRVYVSATGTVRAIDTATNTLVGTASVPSSTGIGLSSDGGKLYVAQGNLNTLSVVDTATMAVSGPFASGTGVYAVAVSPDGTHEYASTTNGINGTVRVHDATNALVATITLPTAGARS